MKKLIYPLLFCTLSCFAFQAQEKSIDTIEVVLLGTFHYRASSDADRTEFPDLFTDKRQNELEELTEKLAQLNIAKIFIERQEKYQVKNDSLYHL